MNDQLREDIVRRLQDDLQFVTKGSSKFLTRGACPDCHKREAFISSAEPWMVKCGREKRCGAQFHVKELFPDLFDTWSERFGKKQQVNGSQRPSGTEVADAYLSIGRGFDTAKIKGWYSQEYYVDHTRNISSATVRFPMGDNGYWERIIDKPQRFGKKKAHVKKGFSFKGTWWTPPGVDLTTAEEVWVVEGIFDAIALYHIGIVAVSSISCSNYPDQALAELRNACAAKNVKAPAIVWAFDPDTAGSRYAVRWAREARDQGWQCKAAQPPANGKLKRDWNDAFQRGELTGDHAKANLEQCRYLGDLLLAESATQKALLIYKREEKRDFPFEFRSRLYWFKLDMDKLTKEMQELENSGKAMGSEELREEALKASGGINQVASCYPTALYYQANTITDEAWYYWRIEFPNDRIPVKNTFSGGQLASASEFKKRLLGVGPGAIWTGSSHQLDRLLQEQLPNIKTVETIDFVGYAKEHGCYVFGDLAVKDGKVSELNEEDFFDIGRLSIKTLSQSVTLHINPKPEDYKKHWAKTLAECFGAQGVVALAYWLGSMYAEQIRQRQKSFPFLEIVGEAGAGKSTLIEFLWKLYGRRDYEGFDPSKATLAARARNFAQVANLPVVLIESDRDQDAGAKAKQFDWDELKTAYNGRSVRSRGQKNGGNDTYEPPFRGAIVISQNAAVNASDAILQRIVHLHFTREHQTQNSKQLAEQLEKIPADHVSHFALIAASSEHKVLDLIDNRMPIHERSLSALPEIRVHRIAKNHAQILSLVDALGKDGLDLLPEECIEPARQLCYEMAIERQSAVNADHPIVQEFWEAFDFIENLRSETTLNHYGKEAKQIAINLKHFEQEAAERKLRVPTTSELKRHLRTSRGRKFVDANRTVRSEVRMGMNKSPSVKCWVFDKER